ncbi:hypothetical protein QC764_110060 [Podospora pseudoanserina]|uniref:Uncharacterized protein n=1 Tax=Podospora pseudoanserina TaxID=2609844 RepID=A0ABR0IMY3_9PEZI|nr:hypothetical protein QC764_110060 [Podospora pseudoanserina]
MPSIFGRSGSGTPAGARAKTGKSIRGAIISAPIPIPSTVDDDEFPMRKPGSAKASTVTDEEFPIRRPGTGIATPLPLANEHSPSLDGKHERDHEKGSGDERDLPDEVVPVSSMLGDAVDKETGEIIPEAPSDPPPGPPSRLSTPAGAPPAPRTASTTPPNRTSPRGPSPQGISPSRVSPPRASPPARRATQPAISTQLRYSTISDAPSKNTTQSTVPQRKKSTLRSALGKLFGRGKKKQNVQDTSPTPIPEVEPVSSIQHRSDPTALGRPNHPPAKRSASLPISEFDRPLRSHSIGPDDIMAIESARNSMQLAGEGGLSVANPNNRRRAATTTSRMMFQQRLRNPEWGAGLSPRPASAQGRGGSSKEENHAVTHDPDEIGRAITSDSGHGLRRRSRSLSGLQDFANARPVTARRRSDEMRFWRQSYDPTGLMSPLSSNAPDIDDTGVVDVSAPDSPAVEVPPKTPPQPFNFGLLSKDMLGMKITHAANLDTRVGNLESRTRKLERVVTQLCHAVPGFRGPLGDTTPTPATSQNEPFPVQKKVSVQQPQFGFSTSTPPPTIPAIYNPIPPTPVQPSSSSRKSLETEDRDTHSLLSFGEAPTFIGSLHPPSSSATQAAQSLTVAAPPPPPPPPLPPTPIPSRPIEETITQLKAELASERAARRDLESQVRKLSERLNTLSSTVFAMVRSPSESRSQERLIAPAASSSSLSTGSPLLLPNSLKGTPTTRAKSHVPAVTQQGQEQLSVFDDDDDDDDDDDEEEEEEEKDFQTPMEVVKYGAFGEELKDHGVVGEEGGDGEGEWGGNLDGDGGGEENKRRKAARTLSLSQLTLGRGGGRGQV